MKRIELERMQNICGGGKNATCRFFGGVWLARLISGPWTGWGFGVATGTWVGAKAYGCFD